MLREGRREKRGPKEIAVSFVSRPLPLSLWFTCSYLAVHTMCRRKRTEKGERERGRKLFRLKVIRGTTGDVRKSVMDRG